MSRNWRVAAVEGSVTRQQVVNAAGTRAVRDSHVAVAPLTGRIAEVEHAGQ
jgi:hypothetical protein